MSGQTGDPLGNTLKVSMKIAGGALIPSFATIIFNALNYIFDNYQKVPPAELSPSTFDIAVGCSFAIFGICITTQDHTTVNKLQILLMVLILLVIGGEMLAPAFLHMNKIGMIIVVDVLSFVGLCWAILIGDPS